MLRSSGCGFVKKRRCGVVGAHMSSKACGNMYLLCSAVRVVDEEVGDETAVGSGSGERVDGCGDLDSANVEVDGLLGADEGGLGVCVEHMINKRALVAGGW